MTGALGELLDRVRGWHRLPAWPGVFALKGIRKRLRERNLYDTGPTPPPAGVPPERLPAAAWSSAIRTLDGTGNDLGDPYMGAARTPFGRNTPPAFEDEDRLGTPPAGEVSERLLTREAFIPAPSLNLLAAAWLQFEVHDWFAHQQDRTDPEYRARLEGIGDDTATMPAPLARDPSGTCPHPRFLSDQTHWWDASQLYGADAEFAAALRTREHGRLLTDAGLLTAMEPYLTRPDDPGGMGRGVAANPPVPNLWVGTALLHGLFAREHNAICDALRAEHPSWDDDRLYETARLVNAAVMAKIHTVEWTPAIIGHPATVRGIRATWHGLLGERVRRRAGRVSAGEVLSGLPGSRLDHDGAPYALTEEFVAVYRMHQLLPDDVQFRRAADHAPTERWELEDLAVARGDLGRPRRRLEALPAADALYSFGVANPGAITLHNYPRLLQRLRSPDHPGVLDLGAVDIHRTRETGVPRYNDFRRLFRLRPAATFHDLAGGDERWAREIREVYGGRLQDVDLLIGLFAERPPRGFAFSDTAFRVFLLMATRRLRSDRFFTTDFRPEVYTPAGMRWIADATFTGILRRHHPELAGVLEGVGNPFAPWLEDGR